MDIWKDSYLIVVFEKQYTMINIEGAKNKWH